MQQACAEQLDRPRLDDCVEYERAARQPLAIVAVTAVNEHWLVEQLVADGSAGAATCDFLYHVNEPNGANNLFSSAGPRIPTSGDASRATHARLPGPSRPDDARFRDS